MYYLLHEIRSRHLVLSCLATLTLLTAVNCSSYGCKEYEVVGNDRLFIDDCERLSCEEYTNEGLQNISLHQVFDEIFRENQLLSSVIINTAPLWQIPQELCNLKHLREIWLQANCLSSLPLNCFDQLLNLEVISIRYNRIEVLPDGLFDGLNKLHTLDLSFNRIKLIGGRFLTKVNDSISLKYVNVNGNLLTSIGPWPFIHASAKKKFYAYMRLNNISSFTNDIKVKFECNTTRGSDLEIVLNFYGNSIQHLSSMVYTYFGDIRTMICFFTGGKHNNGIMLKLEGNPLSCDCVDYKTRTMLTKFSRNDLMNNMRCFNPPELFNERYSTAPLDRWVCNMTGTTSCIRDCRCIYQPSRAHFKIDCSTRSQSILWNGLPKYLPPINSITNTTAYYNLKFTGNYVPTLMNMDYFNSTKVLDLSGVQMKSIPDEVIGSLANVEDLNLCCNSLETLPRSIVNVTLAAKTMKLYGNVWRCECKDAWMKDWLTDVQGKLERPYSIHCSSPSWLAGRMILAIEKHEFCENPVLKQRNQVIYWSLISAASALLLVVLIAFVRKRFHTKRHLYLDRRPFERL